MNDADGTASLKRVLARGASIVSTIGGLDLEAFKGYNATNIVMTQTPQSSHEGLRRLARMVEERTLLVPISEERALRNATQAIDDGKSGRLTGKLVLTVAR